MFGQKAMKVENMLKIKEEFDYKSLSRKIDVQLDKLIAENERQQKAFENEVEKITLEAQCRIAEVERNFADGLEKERLKCQMEYMELVKELEQKLVLNQERNDRYSFVADTDSGEGPAQSSPDELANVKMLLETESKRRKEAEEEVKRLKNQLGIYTQADAGGDLEAIKLHNMLEDEVNQKKKT
ncbi:kinesin-like protein KIN-UB isoform X2 [Lotus japonicus]|uniref:kinesin-like protein KIN-UB isoform X2 n=1 Tax=Lotus japonicus TaxID=34305 RepID=UPI00258CEDA5|nr:kinesin-like protein KIN-UB isoform X2 [Lotus japonicus]XP_057435489.1 kinesin-like protein KIN-UB isoform X2 [Lotus japonicus]XP_057435490.1 kinesin-like protein KIN-UB isoform X2 [Lotus japonicus]XP_057435491.1 kinesin-like protein KIN-UB isoform X2 [Lotus japonicus]XP_057435492.1 kinesin-like protein KIN-UB isoform X2 [Lotus japonicus]